MPRPLRFIVAAFVLCAGLLTLDSLLRSRTLPPPAAPAPTTTRVELKDWSRVAYVLYATDADYMCNALMIFDSLKRLGARPDRVLIYPDLYEDRAADAPETRILREARDRYGVKLAPGALLSHMGQPGFDHTWAESYTKLLAFNLTQYDRVLALDSDATVLQPLDNLFQLPAATIAMPRAYWTNTSRLGSHLVLIQPSALEFERVLRATDRVRKGEYDMEVLNKLYRDVTLVIPHRPNAMISGELRGKTNQHHAYLSDETQTWDLQRELKLAKYVHFSDWPLPKPWDPAILDLVEAEKSECDGADCRGRDLWVNLYEDFATRRKKICGGLHDSFLSRPTSG